MNENPAGRPQWITTRQLVRAVWHLMGATAGLCLGLAGFFWARIADDQPMWTRLLVLAIAICAGVGLSLFLFWYVRVMG